ncbi:hypothetical protein [Streptomyces sp. BRA346]|uniref:hypothetical protein n=1 Tax=Streptomyces sp. BRA346 TaxID=2878199 RepID=UPI004064340A
MVEKEITRPEILDVAPEIADAGILGSYTFIVGFPGDQLAAQGQKLSAYWWWFCRTAPLIAPASRGLPRHRASTRQRHVATTFSNISVFDD